MCKSVCDANYCLALLLFCLNTPLLFLIWCLHTNKRRPCSSTLSGHPSSSFFGKIWRKSGFFLRENLGETMFFSSAKSRGNHVFFFGKIWRKPCFFFGKTWRKPCFFLRENLEETMFFSSGKSRGNHFFWEHLKETIKYEFSCIFCSL